MHGVFSSVSGAHNIKSDPIDPSGDTVLVLGDVRDVSKYGPCGSKINTRYPYSCKVSMVYNDNSPDSNTLTLKTILSQMNSKTNVMNTLKLEPNPKATIINKTLINQLNNMCFVCSYSQTSINDKLSQPTSWWLDGFSDGGDVRGTMNGYPDPSGNFTQQLNVPKTVSTYLSDKNYMPSQKSYEYSVTGQKYIDSNSIDDIANIGKFCPSIMSISNITFKLDKSQPVPLKQSFVLDSMYRGIDRNISNGNADNYHGFFMGSYGLFKHSFGDLSKDMNVNKVPNPMNCGEGFSKALLNASTSDPREVFRTYISRTADYIGFNEKGSYGDFPPPPMFKPNNEKPTELNTDICFMDASNIVTFTKNT